MSALLWLLVAGLVGVNAGALVLDDEAYTIRHALKYTLFPFATLFRFLAVAQRRSMLHRKAAVDALAGLTLTYQAMRRTGDAVGAAEQLLEFTRDTGDPQFIALAGIRTSFITRVDTGAILAATPRATPCANPQHSCD